MVDIEVVDVVEGSTVAGVAGNIVAAVAGNIVAVIVGKIVAETENAVRCCCMQDSAVEHKCNKYGPIFFLFT